MSTITRITPFLWFERGAADAARFYTAIFANSRIEAQSEMMTTFWLDGLRLIAFDGGPMFAFNEAISLFVTCETQAEIDHYWNALLADGGEPSRCGWLTDKFGVSWQVVPTVLGELLGHEDETRAKRAFDAMMTMSKLDIAALERA